MWTAVGLLVLVALPSAGAAPRPCAGATPTIVGTNGPDVLVGTKGDDVIDGRGGDDVIDGRGGDDLICGGSGDDTIYGGFGDDTLRGGPGNDVLDGGAGRDVLLGMDGDDRLTGAGHADVLDGGRGIDSCDGGPGVDRAAGCETVAATESGQVPWPLLRPGPRQVALTFDDGPSSVYTPQVLDVLARYRVPATFFVIGTSAQARPAILQRMAAEGHSVQNHTWDHAWLTRHADSSIEEQLARANRVIEQVTGERPNCFRPPYGAVNDRVRRVAGGLGLTAIMWDVDPWDWKHPGATSVGYRVLRATSGGDIVLMHDTAGPSVVGALPRIIEGLRARGYEFVPICKIPGIAP